MAIAIIRRGGRRRRGGRVIHRMMLLGRRGSIRHVELRFRTRVRVARVIMVLIGDRVGVVVIHIR